MPPPPVVYHLALYRVLGDDLLIRSVTEVDSLKAVESQAVSWLSDDRGSPRPDRCVQVHYDGSTFGWYHVEPDGLGHRIVPTGLVHARGDDRV